MAGRQWSGIRASCGWFQVQASRLVPRRGAVLERMNKTAVQYSFTLDAVLKVFTIAKSNGFYLVAVLGKHDYLRHQTPAPSVVFSVVASILSLEEELT
jgi:hypothetical protein